MNIFLFIVAYLVIPFIIFGINDFFYGYFGGHYGGSVYDNGESDVFFCHAAWPFVTIVLPIMWIICYIIELYDKLNINIRFNGMDSFEKLGRKKYDQRNDLDYQAKKYLTGDKDGSD